MPNNMKKAGIKYNTGGNFEYGKKYVDPASFDGPVDYAKNTGMYLGNKMKEGVGKIGSFFGFKHGGPVKMKSGKNVPGMYKTGGMYDGMDSPKPKGIFHKSFKK
jgi:hypothetical protein